MISSCVCACALRGLQRVSDPLELELKVVVSHLMWVLETEPRSSGRESSAPNHWAVSLFLHFLLNELKSKVLAKIRCRQIGQWKGGI